MAWDSLSDRLDDLPLVLAGPILRRVEKDTVSVWLALKEERKGIVLTVYDDTDIPQMVGMQDTVSLGKHLHVVVITASLIPGKDILSPGITYQYEVIAKGLDLKADAAVCYNNYKLPTFSLPPNDLKDLRITHASCRKMHSPDNDALVSLNGMIRLASVPLPTEPLVYPAPSFAKTRPHQLFLTGDQIYADDVDPILLFLLRDAQQALLGWTEDLPVGEANAPKSFKDVYKPFNLEVDQRSKIIEAESGFQFPDEWAIPANHLMTLGDYYCMYIFMWSPVLWPLLYPTFAEVYPSYISLVSPRASKEQQEKFDESVARAKEYPTQLGPIRQALANIPTYMICDDHEITDDWFLDMNWCKQVLSKALGRRIMQNGMTAFALFQAWGNTPEQFVPNATGKPPKPGQQLLATLSKWKDNALNYAQPDPQRTFTTGVTNPTYWDTIYAVLGLPSLNATIQARELTPVSKQRLYYNYYINWGTHEVFVLDTRTQRAYPGDSDSNFPALISRSGLEQQLVAFSPAAEVTFLVIATPISGVPHIEEALLGKGRTVARYFKIPIIDAWENNRISLSTDTNINYFSDAEAYAYQEVGLQNLYAVIADRVAVRQALTTFTGPARIVVLSGDVHYGFTNRVEFWGTRFYGMDDSSLRLAHPAHFVLAQLCASALKNEHDGFTRVPIYGIDNVNTGNIGLQSMHEVGYTTDELQNPGKFMGWVLPASGSQRRVIGKWNWKYAGRTSDWEVKKDEQIFDIRKNKNFNGKNPESIAVDPDWTYRIDYITTIPGEARPTDSISLPQPLVAPITAQDPLEYKLVAQNNYRTYCSSDGPGRQLVGRNNIGEVFFEWGTTENTKQLRHTLWWSAESPTTGLDGPAKLPLSNFRLLLGEDATKYPKPTV